MTEVLSQSYIKLTLDIDKEDTTVLVNLSRVLQVDVDPTTSMARIWFSETDLLLVREPIQYIIEEIERKSGRISV